MTIANGGQLLQEITEFLNKESELLDDRKFKEWFDLFTEDMSYQIPIRFTADRKQSSDFCSNAWVMNEDRGSMEVRLSRLDTDYAWAEIPASRTRHFVSNIRLYEGEKDDEVLVKENLLVYRSMFDDPTYDLLSGERQDTLRRVDTGWKIAKRVVYLDQTTISTHNLAIFL
ncbi:MULTISPECIES: aromatic-ring-hydroxylating dioxygenase subunit beta [unclassified Paenibacillus]|uniref:aromatic-ring-hydroxylating dioxygenase subunit beta n=1 Tax=unclassified Paenibacillus TaxID=185978 RepID=UPI001AE76D58|nr:MULTISPECIES: aromatic-ring-hydroxylating dioxygenase subunit beta [unclassified Paenibacillus]MBP1154922.1 3-phenylpropionate/cinnamic acid dioxygenase small subunit [Paenibacillus sp. PvP091]MBP1169694.1 3-phenylpropionate/cinnamic acid dioxygenase small subunit [Paenibacillus sp. PvR098]MBP2440722.1 3-phenylpropionate/cinnamic acid dioxygenase small subunit [Paenibacillus sp. PvP052]